MKSKMVLNVWAAMKKFIIQDLKMLKITGFTKIRSVAMFAIPRRIKTVMDVMLERIKKGLNSIRPKNPICSLRSALTHLNPEKDPNPLLLCVMFPWTRIRSNFMWRMV
jgi:hypothetical protein